MVGLRTRTYTHYIHTPIRLYAYTPTRPYAPPAHTPTHRQLFLLNLEPLFSATRKQIRNPVGFWGYSVERAGAVTGGGQFAEWPVGPTKLVMERFEAGAQIDG